MQLLQPGYFLQYRIDPFLFDGPLARQEFSLTRVNKDVLVIHTNLSGIILESSFKNHFGNKVL